RLDSYPSFPQYNNSVVGKWGNYNTNSARYLRNDTGQMIMLDEDDNEIILDPTNPEHKPVPAPSNSYPANSDGHAIGTAEFHPQRAADTSNAAEQMHLITPLERRSLFASANWDITDDVRFASDMAYTARTSNRQIAGYPLQSTAIGGAMAGGVWAVNPATG